MTYTQWFMRTEKPVHSGVYEVLCDFDHKAGFAKWDGEKWSFVGFFHVFKDEVRAFEFAAETDLYHNVDFKFVKFWRGLVND